MPARSKTGVKKEKQAANPVKASAATKAKDAAKKATKKASKRPNKENDKSSAATVQQSAKQSQQKNQKTPHQRSASPDIDALKARIKQLEEAAQAKSIKTSKKILQPDGTAGEDYNLQTAMGLGGDDRTYNAIRRGVRSILDKSGLDYRVRWDRQPVDTIAKIFKVARQRFPYLENFIQDWPTKELAKSRLKNRRAYCKKQGYDATDFGMASSSSPAVGNEDGVNESGDEDEESEYMNHDDDGDDGEGGSNAGDEDDDE